MSVLKIDLDIKPSKEWQEKWEHTREAILKSLGLTLIGIRKHESNKGWHYFLEVAEMLSDNDTNMTQLLCGDDHTRCKINAWRIERGIPHWNKIFDRKLWRKNQEFIECFYCGNKIPLITKVKK